jgi:hypothetical protein
MAATAKNAKIPGRGPREMPYTTNPINRTRPSKEFTILLMPAPLMKGVRRNITILIPTTVFPGVVASFILLE